MAKTYVSFDKTGYYHIIKADLKFDVEAPKVGSVLKIYALTSAVDLNKLTWNNAYGNDTSTVGMKATNVCTGAPIATVTLTEDTTYTVNVTDALKSLEKNDDVVFVITAEDGVNPQKVSNFELNIASTVYAENTEKAVLKEVNGTVFVEVPYIIDAEIEKVEFFVDDKASIGEVVINGQTIKISPVLSEGEHTAYAVITYADGTVKQSDEIEFKVGNSSAVLGDVNGDGEVNTVDLAELKLFLAGLGEVQGNADLNDDEKIDTVDLAELKLQLAGLS
jgi:hypothetical protein